MVAMQRILFLTDFSVEANNNICLRKEMDQGSPRAMIESPLFLCVDVLRTQVFADGIGKLGGTGADKENGLTIHTHFSV